MYELTEKIWKTRDTVRINIEMPKECAELIIKNTERLANSMKGKDLMKEMVQEIFYTDLMDFTLQMRTELMKSNNL